VNHVIVVDLGYGDAGKGTVVDWLCARESDRPVHTVVRFNGGAQAAHNVVAPDGRRHAFAQFGAGTFTPGVRTHLSRFVLVEPLALAAEAAHLADIGMPDALDRLTVDRDALLTTPYHKAANRAREAARGDGRHGSCGMGVGETAAYALAHPGDAPRAGDCATPRVLTRRLTALREHLADELGGLSAPPVADVVDAYRAFAERVKIVDGGHLARLLRAGPVVFEGAQGVLLDEWRGFHPYTTWSTTTFANAEQLLAEAGQQAVRLGVTRCYMTRHGPGPFVTEDPGLDIPEPHNGHNEWQGVFRTGHFDAVALRYAIEVTGGVDGIALTHLDTAADRPGLRVCHAYQANGRTLTRLRPGPARDLGHQEHLTKTLLAARPLYTLPDGDWAAFVEQTADAPVTLRSHGPTVADKTASGHLLQGGRVRGRTSRLAPVGGCSTVSTWPVPWG
jgi:adenylosuccinate synthase